MKKCMQTGALLALIGGSPMMATALEGGHQLELVTRAVYYFDDGLNYPSSKVPSPKYVEYDQSAIGVQLNYKSPYWAEMFGFDASGYGVMKLNDSGAASSNLLDVNNSGQVENTFATLGQAYLKFKYKTLAQAKFGRQLQNSLLLKSNTSRAVPDTFSGFSGSLTPVQGLQVYGAIYDQWRPRSRGEFEKFRTEATAAGVANSIDYVSLFGASYVDGQLAVTAEYLNAKDYLNKLGIVGSYTLPFDKNSLKLTLGVLNSQDAGNLFVCGAESKMDCTGTGRISSNGTGAFVDADLRVSSFTFGAAIAKFDGIWIEDNFAANALKTGSLTQDHGTNPFPTTAGIGPDMTNNGETVISGRLAYDWKQYIAGLKTSFKYAHGFGAKSSNLSNAARGSENYREFDLQYAIPFVKNLSFRYVYMNYDSRIENGSTTATIKGLQKVDYDQHRVFLDYTYAF